MIALNRTLLCVVLSIAGWCVPLSVSASDPDAALVAAVSNGQSEKIREALEAGADPDQYGADNDVSLVVAALERYDLEALELLLEYGADPDAHPSDEDGSVATVSPLAFAVYTGEVEAARLLLRYGADVNDQQGSGKDTPLMIAAITGRRPVAVLLYRHGADLTLTDANGKTALDFAKGKGNGVLVAFLEDPVGYLRDVNRQLYDAVLASDVASVDSALDRGADPDFPDHDSGFTVLTRAAGIGNVEVVERLLDAGAHCNRVDSHQDTPLADAVGSERLNVARLLLERGADPRARVGLGWTALHWAARDGHVDLVRRLLASGAEVDPTADTESGEFTPLMLAAWNNRVQVAEVLVASGADPHKANARGDTAASEARKGGHVPLLQALEDPQRFPAVIANLELMQASIDGELEAAIVALAAGAEPEYRQPDGWTALHYAVRSGNADIVNALLDRSWPLDGIAQSGEGSNTPLILAAWNGFLEIARMLLDAGARIDQVNAKGETALMVAEFQDQPALAGYLRDLSSYDVQHANLALITAAQQGDHNAVREAVARGADADFVATDGWRALHYVSRDGRLEIVEWLLARGVEVSPCASTKAGAFDPLKLAAWNGKLPSARRLVEAGADPDSSDCQGPSARVIAVQQRQHHISAYFEGPDRYEQLLAGQQLLDAARRGDVQQLKQALDAGADPDSRDGHGRSALHHVIYEFEKGTRQHFGAPQAENLSQLLSAKADPQLLADTPHGERTPLMLAVEARSLSAAERLLKAGANPNRTNRQGESALSLARAGDRKPFIALFETPEKFESIKRQQQLDSNAGIYAQLGSTQELAEALEEGGNPNHRVGDKTILDYTVIRKYLEAMQLLLDYGADPNLGQALELAVQQGNLKAVQALIAAGADPERTNDQGESALAIATRFDKVSVMHYLINHDTRELVDKHRLLAAAGRGDRHDVEARLNDGADPGFADHRAWTALHHAAFNGHLDVTDLLIRRGAGLSDKTKRGRVPLLLAVSAGHPRVALRLLAGGATAPLPMPPGVMSGRWSTRQGCPLLRHGWRTPMVSGPSSTGA